MEKRFLLALVLTMGVVYLYSQLYPPVVPPAPAGADSVIAALPVPGQAPGQAAVPALPQPAAAAPGRDVEVVSPLYRYVFSTRGATLHAAELLRYSSYVAEGPVQLVPAGADDVLGHRVAAGGQVLDLTALPFRASANSLRLTPEGGPQTLTFTWAGQGVSAEIAYTFHPDQYLVQVQGRVTGISGETELQTVLGPGLAPHDAPEHAAERELQVAAWNVADEEIDVIALRKVEEPEVLAGPLAWAGIKDRYFLLALLPGEGRTLTRVAVEDLPDYPFVVEGEERVSPRALATAAQALPADGTFAFEAYLGPQEHGRLVAAGHQLEEVNPYGYRWLRPVVRPIAAVILWVLNELHDNLGIAYGWVLVIFGVMVRVVTWPLNAKAMRAQMRNMEKQPILQARMREVQEKYGDDPPRMQKEMMQVYQEVGMSPLSMLSGCLPMMVPMPVLITLFFVFQAAIEFRGTEFAWLPDLSLRDPYYILPIFLVASMFALQWVSVKLSGMEQNPQTQMMLYIMPLMMGAFFWIMPSGLNLYYATTNVASLPQQLLIARERRRAADEKKALDAAAEREKRGPPGRKAKGR